MNCYYILHTGTGYRKKQLSMYFIICLLNFYSANLWARCNGGKKSESFLVCVSREMRISWWDRTNKMMLSLEWCSHFRPQLRVMVRSVRKALRRGPNMKWTSFWAISGNNTITMQIYPSNQVRASYLLSLELEEHRGSCQYTRFHPSIPSWIHSSFSKVLSIVSCVLSVEHGRSCDRSWGQRTKDSHGAYIPLQKLIVSNYYTTNYTWNKSFKEVQIDKGMSNLVWDNQVSF